MFPWVTESTISICLAARKVPKINLGPHTGGFRTEGQDGVIRGTLAASQRVDKGKEAVRIHQALRGADTLKAEGTGCACCAKTFKRGSMFELGAFSGGSNSVQSSGGQTRAYFAELPFPATQRKGAMVRIGCGG